MREGIEGQKSDEEWSSGGESERGEECKKSRRV
jgi:hypothetical protein